MTGQDPNTLIEFLRQQRQSRTFTGDPIASQSIASILEVARWTGSAGNKQRWRLVVVQDTGIKTQLAEVKSDTGWVADSGVVIAILTEGTTPTAHRFDAGRMAERILLAASAEGLAAGIFAWGDDQSSASARAILRVPEDLQVFAAVAIGHAQEIRPAPSSRGGRKSLDEIVVHDRFPTSDTR